MAVIAEAEEAGGAAATATAAAAAAAPAHGVDRSNTVARPQDGDGEKTEGEVRPSEAADSDGDARPGEGAADDEAAEKAEKEPEAGLPANGGLSAEQVAAHLKQVAEYRLEGNEHFKAGRWQEAIDSYSLAVTACPPGNEAAAAVFSNRAAAMLKLGLYDDAVRDCSRCLELDQRYVKALVRRATAFEALDKLDEALADFTAALELEPRNAVAAEGARTLPPRINERNEKLKDEMLGKLKGLGNMVLGKFGLSTDNFNFVQDPNTGSYSVNFNQNGGGGGGCDGGAQS